MFHGVTQKIKLAQFFLRHGVYKSLTYLLTYNDELLDCFSDFSCSSVFFSVLLIITIILVQLTRLTSVFKYMLKSSHCTAAHTLFSIDELQDQRSPGNNTGTSRQEVAVKIYNTVNEVINTSQISTHHILSINTVI